MYDGGKVEESSGEEDTKQRSKFSPEAEQGCTGADLGTSGGASKKKVWLTPLDDQVKIIDFGGATYADEKHNSIINTRQYRAPEVILNCCQWNEKSDIWSLVCILVELYTGELFFETREDVEHLCMIEKQCGPFPEWMAKNCDDEKIKTKFQPNFETSTYKGKEMRLSFPECLKNESSIR